MNRWLILFCAFLLFAGMLIGEDITTVEKLAAECAAGNQEACKKLTDIAESDKDSDIREAAVRKLTDQSVLANIALEDSSLSLIAIENLADIASLNKAATDDKDWRVHLIFKFIAAFDSVPYKHRERLMEEVLPAIQILSYPAVVSAVGEIESIETEWDGNSQNYREGGGYLMIGGKIGEKKGEIFTCSIEVRKLSRSLSHTWSTDFPKKIFSSEPDFRPAEVNTVDLLRKPFEKLTDQAVLADIARNHRNSSIREAAVEKLTNQKLLADIAKNDEEWSVRKAAVEKLTDQKLLADIIKNDESSGVCEAAEKRLEELQGK